MSFEHVSYCRDVSSRFENPEQRMASYERQLMEHKRTEIWLRAALTRDKALLQDKDEVMRRHELLNRECHHRLMNNLQMIAAMLSLQGRQEANAEAASHLAIAGNRVRAVGHLHCHLHSMDDAPFIEFKRYLDELCCDHATMSLSEECPDQRIVVEAIDLRLPTTTGLPLGLIVNELITNAIKHGKGPITVTLAQTESGHALSVCNGGPPLPESFDPTACKGLGMTLVSSLAAQIGGELRIDRGDDNDRTRFTVLFT
jgi:two-component sensor histidine kinase